MTVDMEDLRHTGSSIIGFTILDVKNYELAKTSGEMSQVISYTISVHSSEIRGLRSTKCPGLCRQRPEHS